MERDQSADVRWKRFEEVAARIEAYLAPTGAVVKLNDHVRDKKTGQLRQVDASIRYNVGSVELLITLECRRHSDPQDVTWIEQLAKKRENIGANATIAIASEGFFKTAGISAAFENVYPRTLEELEADGLDWLRFTHVDAQEKIYSIRLIGVELWDPALDDEIQIDEKLFTDGAKRLDLYPLFIKTKTGQRFNSFHTSPFVFRSCREPIGSPGTRTQTRLRHTSNGSATTGAYLWRLITVTNPCGSYTWSLRSELSAIVFRLRTYFDTKRMKEPSWRGLSST